MPTFKVPPAELGRVLRRHAEMGPRVARMGLRVGVERGRALVVRRTPVGIPPGAMRQAWAVFPWGALGWKLDNSSPHSAIVEAGARPHPVSREGVEAIREWVARVLPLITTKSGDTRKATAAERDASGALARHTGATDKLSKKQRRLRDLGKLIDSITWAIVAKLKREGQKPRWVVRDVLPELRKMAGEEVGKAVAAFLASAPKGI